MNLTYVRYIFLFLSIRNCSSEEVLEGCEYDSVGRIYYCNDISHIFPNQYYGNYHLRCTYCNISKFTERTFPFTNSLDSFNVSYSRIKVISRRAFSKLTASQFIYLDHNEIQDIAEDAFAGAKQLYELHLEHNHLKKLRPRFLNDVGTNSVDLSYNRIEEISDKAFEGIIGLLVLDLSHNKIDKLHRYSFDGLTALELLDLQENRICYLPLGILSTLNSLRTLNFSNNKLSSFALGTFSGMTSLNELDLANNSLPYFDGDFLLSLSSLQTLDISGNGIYYFDGFTITENSPSLKSLKMDHNIFSCSSLRTLVKHFRRAKIEITTSSGSYDVQNIFGIACTEAEINRNISYKKFFALAQEEAVRITKTC